MRAERKNFDSALEEQMRRGDEYWAENERLRALYEAVTQWANAMSREDCRASEIQLFNVYASVKDGGE